MDRKEVMAFFNKRPRNCLVATANREGEVNVAVYGSPRMIDESTAVLATGDKRTFYYLKENPKAVMIVVEPGEIKQDSKGVRLYLEVSSIETQGDLFNEVREGVEKRVGKEAADGLQAAILFKITDIRPLIDPMS